MIQGHLGVNIGSECFTDMDYADDVALLVESCQDLVDYLETIGQFGKEASNYGLKINWSKNKNAARWCPGCDARSCTCGGQPDGACPGFCYFGSHVEADGSSGPDVRQGVSIACSFEQPPKLDMEARHPYGHKALRVPGIHTDSPPVRRRDMDADQGFGDKVECVPTLVPQADPVRSLLCT